MSLQEQGSLTGVLKCVGEAGGMPGCEAAAADVPDTVRPNCCEGLVPLPSGWADAALGAAAGLDCGGHGAAASARQLQVPAAKGSRSDLTEWAAEQQDSSAHLDNEQFVDVLQLVRPEDLLATLHEHHCDWLQ